MNSAPPILDYRRVRPKPQRIPGRTHGTVHFAMGMLFIAFGWIFVVRAILQYVTGMAPFPGAASIVSLLVLAASIGLGLALRGRR